MITPKRLLHLVTKWRKLAELGRKRLTSNISHKHIRNHHFKARKGHFIVYTTDGYRYELPLTYLESSVLRALFATSEEMFGLDGNEHITLPCDAVFMEFIVAFLKNELSVNVEKALLSSIAEMSSDKCCSGYFSLFDGEKNQVGLVSGF